MNTTPASEATQETTAAADDALDTAEGIDQPEPDEQDKATESSKSGKEAAKYRRQLRETETERDQLSEALTAARRQLVESMSGLAKPGALWAAGTDVNDLLDDDGQIDPSKVAEAVENASTTLGLVRTPKPDRSQGSTAIGRTASEDFAAAFSMSDQ